MHLCALLGPSCADAITIGIGANCPLARGFFTAKCTIKVGVVQAQRETHGIPALLSFLLPGLGQIVKGDVATFFGIWIAFAVLYIGSLILVANCR